VIADATAVISVVYHLGFADHLTCAGCQVDVTYPPGPIVGGADLGPSAVPAVDTSGVFDVREATAADKMAVAHVHVRSWQQGYRGLVAQDYLDGLRPEDMATRYAFETMDLRGPYTLVAVDRDAIHGHITIGRSRDDHASDSGEVWSLYVDPLYWGTGVSDALIAAGCDRLSRAGHDAALLWVFSANLRARRFYERTGWTTDGRQRTDAFAGTSLQQVRYVTRLGRQT
jgi:GNAT superfamily N-acetyltransferase